MEDFKIDKKLKLEDCIKVTYAVKIVFPDDWEDLLKKILPFVTDL